MNCPHCGTDLTTTLDEPIDGLIAHMLATTIGERARQIAATAPADEVPDADRIGAIAYLAARGVWEVLALCGDDLTAVHEFLALEETLTAEAPK